MTEREYVEHIRKAAEGYIAWTADPRSAQGCMTWHHVKEAFSPHTMIALCDAWLAQGGRTAPKASEGDFVAPE